MRIEQIDLFYYALPEIRDQSDGSQDSFIVRIRADTGLEGYGESDSSPLLALAAFCTPPSHSNIVNISESLLGQTLDTPDDVRRIYAHARRRALDMAQFPHAYAAADIALWDLLGKHLNTPVFRLLGHERSVPKIAYASQLFGDTPEETHERARQARSRRFRAAKFGWGPMGHFDEAFDIALVRAAREGLGDDAALMVDAGVVWGEDDATALQRANAFRPFDVTWLEESPRARAATRCGRPKTCSTTAASPSCRSIPGALAASRRRSRRTGWLGRAGGRG
jgi:L-alanine-DL-glutamate epimerase-like enolase superfamily enzyme